MDKDIAFLLLRLEAELNAALDQIYYEALAKFRKLARSIGQRTRIDR